LIRDIEVFDEPELEFGAEIRHIDIRFGIMNYGPLDVGSESAPIGFGSAQLGHLRLSKVLSGGWILAGKRFLPKKAISPTYSPVSPVFLPTKDFVPRS